MQLYLGAAGISTLGKFQPPTWILEIYFSNTLLEIRTGSTLVVEVESIEDAVPWIWCMLVLTQLMIGLVQSLCKCLCCGLVEMWR